LKLRTNPKDYPVIYTPLKFDIYFWFISEMIGVAPTTFPSHTQFFCENTCRITYVILRKWMKSEFAHIILFPVSMATKYKVSAH